jgi:hypothetical protein
MVVQVTPNTIRVSEIKEKNEDMTVRLALQTGTLMCQCQVAAGPADSPEDSQVGSPTLRPPHWMRKDLGAGSQAAAACWGCCWHKRIEGTPCWAPPCWDCHCASPLLRPRRQWQTRPSVPRPCPRPHAESWLRHPALGPLRCQPLCRTLQTEKQVLASYMVM